MGTVIHRATIVTSWQKELVAEAHKIATGMFPGLVTEIITSSVNRYQSFMIASCGSKEGWAEADDDALSRQAFRNWIETHDYGDGSNPFEIANVRYGDDWADGEAT